jgi:hypothetical protein
MNVNKHFMIVFQPTHPEVYGNRRRWALKWSPLCAILGEEKSATILERLSRPAKNWKEEKEEIEGRITRKFKGLGRCDFYPK